MSFELRKLHSVKIWRYSQLNVICGIARHHTTGNIALLHYFSKACKVENLPDRQAVLAKDILLSAISSTNTEVRRTLQGKE